MNQELKENIENILKEQCEHAVYCEKDESAWGHKTMTQNDFHTFFDDDMAEEIAHNIMMEIERHILLGRQI